MQDKAQKVIEEFTQLENDLADPAVYTDQTKATKLSQKRKALEPKVELAREYIKYSTQKSDAESLLASESDAEMLDMAKTDLEEAKKRLPNLEEELKLALIPVDPNDEKNSLQY